MPGEQPLPERRSFARQVMAIPVLVGPAPSETESLSAVTGNIRDVSNRGAYFWAPSSFRIGQTLNLSLEVPAKQGRSFNLEIRCEAVVVRTEPAARHSKAVGVAVRILHFDTPKVIRNNDELMERDFFQLQ